MKDVRRGLPTTARLLFRHLGPEDAPFMLRLLNEPSFIRNIGDRGVRTEADAVRYTLEGPVASYERHGYGLYLVTLRSTGAAIGISGLVRRDYLEHADIGFAFLPEHWRRGYAVESATAVRDYAFGELGLRRLLAITSQDNSGSIRVLEKIGLAFEGMISPPGRDEVLRLYAIDRA